MTRLLSLAPILLLAGCGLTTDGQNFWIGFTGMLIMGASCTVTLVFLDKWSPLIRRRFFGKLWCKGRMFHDWISQHEKDQVTGQIIPTSEIKCRTCWETMNWLEHLEVIKKIPRQEWMDPECSLCDHTDGVKLLAKRRNWRPEMTADVLTASFCRRCRKYQARMPSEAVITDEERPEPEPSLHQVHCPQCERAFMAVGELRPEDEIPLCRRCHQGLPSETCRVIRFRRRE